MAADRRLHGQLESADVPGVPSMAIAGAKLPMISKGAHSKGLLNVKLKFK